MITQRQGCIAYGTPIPQGSMTCVGAPGRGHQLQPSNKKLLHEWRKQVTGAAQMFFTETADEYQALRLIAVFTVARPASHYRTGQFREQLRPDAPHYPTRRTGGDLDKLVRAVMDALTQSGHIHDDAQVVDISARKLYDGHPAFGLTKPGVQIEVRPR